jgi:hypothetical protein
MDIPVYQNLFIVFEKIDAFRFIVYLRSSFCFRRHAMTFQAQSVAILTRFVVS